MHGWKKGGQNERRGSVKKVEGDHRHIFCPARKHESDASKPQGGREGKKN